MIIDLANYTAIPTADQVARLKALGVEKAIIGTSYPAADGKYRWPQQIAAFNAGGVPTAEYQFPDRLRRTGAEWWLDCETPAATKDWVRWICARRPTPTGIYTRRNWWLENMPGGAFGWDIKAEFPWLKLWDAAYVHDEGLRCLIALARDDDERRRAIDSEYKLVRPFVPYGGFERRDMVQWHGSVLLAGLNVDLSEEERVYTDQEIDAKVGAVVGQLGVLGKKIDDVARLVALVVPKLANEQNEDVKALLAALAPK